MSTAPFSASLSENIWRNKYRYESPDGRVADRSIDDTWKRAATAAASAEHGHEAFWRTCFQQTLTGFAFLPGGRILAGAGTRYSRTLCNCFVMGFIEDSLTGILDCLKESAVTMQWGGGIGCDFSTLRPRGMAAATRGTVASGPVSFMHLWDATCATLLSTGARRGAMMGTLRCDHPDIEAFIDAKRQRGALTNFNLSVQVSDRFMTAVQRGESWPLIFPTHRTDEAPTRIETYWPAAGRSIQCTVHRTVDARSLWKRIMDAAYDTAEPGVLFVDRINRENNLFYCESITSTNPCGEIPLPPYGACVLGSINLAAAVREPFSRRARLDTDRIAAITTTAVRFLDNVIDLSHYPLDAQAAEARSSRRIGLGITGLADALIMLGRRYDSDEARAIAADALTVIRDSAYRTSIRLAGEKGSFPRFEQDAFLSGDFVRRLPAEIRDGIAEYGIRNSHLLAIAPTGTISLLANNVSSGIEPVFAFEMERRVRDEEGRFESFAVEDFAYAEWKRQARPGDALPAQFVAAHELSAEAHLQMLAVLQPLVDNSISKTINLPESTPRDALEDIYRRAYELGLKGCTVFRSTPATEEILSDHSDAGIFHCQVPHCHSAA